MGYSIDEIEGIGPAYRQKLRPFGIETTDDFLKKCCDSGVDTVKELRTRNAENLTAAMAIANEEKKVARTSPASSTVQRWIEATKTIDPLITH